jgi:hypothetical protein
MDCGDIARLRGKACMQARIGNFCGGITGQRRRASKYHRSCQGCDSKSVLAH